MNIDILNYGHYRVTSHGGRKHDLFNRKTDKVYSISKEDFEFIKHATVSTQNSTPEQRCEAVEWVLEALK